MAGGAGGAFAVESWIYQSGEVPDGAIYFPPQDPGGAVDAHPAIASPAGNGQTRIHDAHKPCRRRTPSCNRMTMKLIPFATLRLTGEPLEPGHYGEIFRMHQDPRVMATLGGVRGEAESRAYLEFNLAHWRRYGFGLWIVRDRADGRVAGRAVIRHLDLDGEDEVEVGYGFYPDWWGQGIATEAARELVRIGFKDLSLPSLVAITQATNQASRRVLEKAGLVQERIVDHSGVPHSLYRAQAEQAIRTA